MFSKKPICTKIDAPMMAVPPCPCVLAEHDLWISYQQGGEDEKWIVSHFDGYLQIRHGYPNDEALGAHPLGKYGLKFYDVFEVKNSPEVEDIKKRNRIHPRHTDASFENDRHWIFTFQDETLDVISRCEPSFQIIEATSAFDAIRKTKNS